MRKNDYNKFKFLVNHLAPNSEYVVKITALNRKGTGRPFVLSTTTKKKPDRLFITKITDTHNSNMDNDFILKNDLNGLGWFTNQQFKSTTYLLSMISISLGILLFIIIIRKKYKRLILMHSALRSNQLNQFATSSNAISISKLFPYNNKKPELMLSNCQSGGDCSLSNEQFDHSLMGCCNVDYREDRDILMPRPQLTTFQSITNNNNNNHSQELVSNSTNNLSNNISNLSNQLQSVQTLNRHQRDQQRCEMNFNRTFNQLALPSSLSVNNNLASLSCSARDLYDTAAVCLFNSNNNNNNNNSNNNNNDNLLDSNLVLTNSASNQNNLNNNDLSISPAPPPISPPPTYEQSTSMTMLSLPHTQSSNPQSLLLSPPLHTNSFTIHHHNHFNHHLNQRTHHPQSTYVDYTNRYQSLNRKVHSKLEEFKQNSLVVKLDDCVKSAEASNCEDSEENDKIVKKDAQNNDESNQEPKDKKLKDDEEDKY